MLGARPNRDHFETKRRIPGAKRSFVFIFGFGFTNTPFRPGCHRDGPICFLSACTTPTVVQTKQTRDSNLSCAQLKDAYAEAQGFESKARKERDVTGISVAAAILFWPAQQEDEATSAPSGQRPFADLACHCLARCAGRLHVASRGQRKRARCDIPTAAPPTMARRCKCGLRFFLLGLSATPQTPRQRGCRPVRCDNKRSTPAPWTLSI